MKRRFEWNRSNECDKDQDQAKRLDTMGSGPSSWAPISYVLSPYFKIKDFEYFHMTSLFNGVNASEAWVKNDAKRTYTEARSARSIKVFTEVAKMIH